MAGVQIDGVNNKIDFDDDQDTSISANTDDTLVIEAGGNTLATFTATTLTINDGTIITTADNTDTLTLISTDADASVGPNLRLYRNSSSPEDGNQLAKIDFEGRNDNSQDVSYFDITSYTRDVSDGEEDGILLIHGIKAGSSVEYIRIDPHADHNGIVFNDGSTDMDFRVESNGNANMLFVDGGENRTGIGTGSPQAQFDVTVPNAKTANAGVWGYLGKTNESSGYAALQCFQIGHANAASRQWQFQTIEQGVANDGIITLQLSGGNVAIGRSTTDAKLDVSGSIRTSSGILFGTDTAAANTLDDYEEGTWTVPSGAVNGITYVVSSTAGVTYTKVGRQVTINASVDFGAHTSDNNATYLGTLPFTPLSNGTFIGKVRTSSDITGCCVELNGSQSYIRLMKDSGGSYDYVTRAESRSETFEFTVTYFV